MPSFNNNNKKSQNQWYSTLPQATQKLLILKAAASLNSFSVSFHQDGAPGMVCGSRRLSSLPCRSRRVWGLVSTSSVDAHPIIPTLRKFALLSFLPCDLS